MSKNAHRLYIFLLSLIVLFTLIYLIFHGYSYYLTPLEERFFHPRHEVLKPSGLTGHGLGVAGSFLILVGVASYMIRKRWRRIGRLGLLKHWLEFHIFLCTLGPVLVLFHTAFKFGGLVAISFWSMVAVFLSGIIGRFLYIQIPRTIEGRELSLNELREMKTRAGERIRDSFNLDESSYRAIAESTVTRTADTERNDLRKIFSNFIDDRRSVRTVRNILKNSGLSRPQYSEVLDMVKHEMSLNRRIERLAFMQDLFRYWHVAHLPFALVMLIIMIIHVAVTVTFGYKWIF